VKKGLLLISLLLVIGLSMIFTSCGKSGTPEPTATANAPGSTTSSVPATTQPTPTVTMGPSYIMPKPAGLETELYSNDEYKFSVEVPKGWTLKEETQGLYIVFNWAGPAGAQIPNVGVTVRKFMQPILVETFITKFETEIYGAGYAENSKTVISEGVVAIEYTMSGTADLTGQTIYHQRGNDFLVVTNTFDGTTDAATIANLKYCASSYKTTQKM
jgi:hypothetical protein